MQQNILRLSGDILGLIAAHSHSVEDFSPTSPENKFGAYQLGKSPPLNEQIKCEQNAGALHPITNLCMHHCITSNPTWCSVKETPELRYGAKL
jgi:hypothetical protein